jgi:hypothetical protein
VLVVKPAAFNKRVQAARRNTLVLAPGSSSVLAN